MDNGDKNQVLIDNPKENFDVQKEKEHNLRVKDLLKLSVRAFRVRPLRTFLTVLGMSVGIGTVFFLISLGYGLQYILIGKLAPTEDSLISLQASYPEDGLLASRETIDEISKISEVEEISPILQTGGEIHYNEYSGDLLVKIIDDKYYRLSGFVPDYALKDSKFEDGVTISATALKLLGIPETVDSLGKIVTVDAIYETSDSQKIVSTKNSITITGIISDETKAPFVFIPVNLMQESPSSFDQFFVKAKDDVSLEKLRAELIKKGFIISARVDTVRQAKKITNIITIVLGVFGVAALIVSSIGMFNTMLISFMERIFEVGIMKSIGATRHDILTLFLTESFLMGLLGGIGGIAMGFALGTAVNFGMNILATYLDGKPVSLFIYSNEFMFLILGVSGVVGLLSGYLPARQAAKLSAREAFLRK
jgi:ABC-type antimicrobial peptide transport system permease subunit